MTTLTERKMLVAASENARGGVAATWAKGCGSRAVVAIRALASKGLLAEVSSYTEREARRGRITLSITTVATITDAGRKALEA